MKNHRVIKILILLILLMPFMVNAEGIEVSSFQELKDAINNKNEEIIIKEDIGFNELLNIDYNVTIDGSNHSLTRENGYLNGLFSTTTGNTLKISNLVIDGGATNWYMDYDNRYYSQANNKGYIRVPTVEDANDMISWIKFFLEATIETAKMQE